MTRAEAAAEADLAMKRLDQRDTAEWATILNAARQQRDAP